ncbi:MAG TPA: CHAD domain-containing protein [Terriglobales bacterium]
MKDLWYQVRLLKPTWPAAVKNFAGELERLADYLSDDHDLAILRRRLLKQFPKDSKQTEALVALIDERRAELELEANRLGTRIYMEKPNAFVRRFEVYWRTWSAESNADSIPLSEQVLIRKKVA